MNPERWRQLKQVFDGALELAPAKRAEFLDKACAGDPSLRREVESLLATHEDADGFLEQPAYEAAPELLADDSEEDPAGRRLGPYILSRKLGQGGMGVVYLAEDPRLGRQVAIKALAPQYTRDEEHRERLRREARVAAAFTHPAIATVYALEEYEGQHYIISEYVRGRNLAEELAAEGPLPLARLVDTALDVARALAAAHEQGIIHRDLKPENVMRTPGGTLKIVDFGLARSRTPHQDSSAFPSRLTGAGTFLGTPAYSSPEQLLGLDVDFHTDQFSLGVMIYELATGRHPFAGTDSVTTIARILEAEPAEISNLRPVIPKSLERIVQTCLQKRPERRYSSTRELVGELEKVKAGPGGAPDRRVAADEEGAAGAAAPRPGPVWWWQFHQAWVGFMYYAMLYPMWKVDQWTQGFAGALLFFCSVAAVGIASNLRIHLWFTSAYYPGELASQRRSVSRWVRGADILFVTLLAAGAASIHEEHAAVATLLVAVAVGSLGAFLLIEPTTTRAAFGETREFSGRS